MKPPQYDFLARMGRVLNSRQSRSVVVTGNIYDLYYLETDDRYVSLIDFLIGKMEHPGRHPHRVRNQRPAPLRPRRRHGTSARGLD